MDRNPEEKIRTLAARMADEMGLELVDVALLGRGSKALLRLTIDKEGGVTLDDCENFSRRIESLMDIEDLIERSYTLEVSSPGLDRPLKTLDDFRKRIGKKVRVVTKEKIHNRSFFEGRLSAVEDTVIRIAIEEKKGVPVEIEIPFEKVKRAQLEIEVR